MGRPTGCWTWAFVRDVTRILDQIKHRKNMGMFSATISREVMDIA